MRTTTHTEAHATLDAFAAGDIEPWELYAQATKWDETGDDLILTFSDGSRLTIPEDGEAVAS